MSIGMSEPISREEQDIYALGRGGHTLTGLYTAEFVYTLENNQNTIPDRFNEEMYDCNQKSEGQFTSHNLS